MYFVYELIDPRCGSVFYVGKGKGNRPHAHEAEARKGKRSRKCERIREIIASGLSPRINIVERFDDEAAAYAAEASHIEKIGLANLTNVCIGGIGSIKPQDPVKDARKTVRKSAKFIRHAVEMYRAGYVAIYRSRHTKELDFVKASYDLAMSLRERAGAEYFDNVVGVQCQPA